MGTSLLEIYAVEIQMYTETQNNKKLKELYSKSLRIKSAIPHPRIMGIIHECGGKMHMSENEWQQAQVDFFESFKNFDEAGSVQRIQVLKYLVLANMLMESEIDPFDSQETKPYRSDPQVEAMSALVVAYQKRDVRKFERILQENEHSIMNDNFIRSYIDELLRSVRTQVLLGLIEPYSRVKLDFLSQELVIPISEVEALLVALILEGRFEGKIDQLKGVLELSRPRPHMKWVNALRELNKNVENLRKSIIMPHRTLDQGITDIEGIAL